MDPKLIGPAPSRRTLNGFVASVAKFLVAFIDSRLVAAVIILDGG